MSDSFQDDDMRALLSTLAAASGKDVRALSEGEPFDPGTVEKIVAEIQSKKDKFDRQVRSGEINGEEFAARCNAMIGESLAKLAEVVGLDVAEQVFGLKPGEQAAVIDPEIAGKTDYRSDDEETDSAE